MADNSFASYANLTGLGSVKFPENLNTGFDTTSTFGNFSNAQIEAGGVAAAAGFSSAYDPTAATFASWSGVQGPQGWTFITTPEDISWNQSAEVTPIKIFGTNQVPVTVGSKGMRELSLSNAMVEGFTRGVQVEDKVSALEALMNFSLVSGNNGGYVNVPVYQVTANDKVYGSGQGGVDGGYFVIKDIKVKETIRDFSGLATRAFVDVSLTQVPPYQVNSGIDQANKSVTGSKSILTEKNESNAKLTAAQVAAKSTTAATAAANQGVTAATTQPAAKPPAKPRAAAVPATRPAAPPPPPLRDVPLF